MTHRYRIAAALLIVAGASGSADAETPAEIEAALAAEVRSADPAFPRFSEERGGRFYRDRHGSDWSCATCHTDDPRAAGRHATTGRAIAPLAPAANVERLTDVAKIEKWFRRNCNDVVGRACSPQEKGDVVAWLTSLVWFEALG